MKTSCMLDWKDRTDSIIERFMTEGEKQVRERNRNFKRSIGYLVLCLLFLVSAALSFSYFSFVKTKEEGARPTAEQAGDSYFDLNPLPTLAPEVANALLLGYGGEGHSGGRLSDSLTLVHVNSNKKLVALVAVPRDLWVNLPVGKNNSAYKKINNAFASGGGELAKRAVGEVVGMQIKYFAAVSFAGFKEAIDELGGIKVDVPVAFDDYYYPVKGLENEICGKTPEEVEEILKTLSGFEIDKQFPCRFEHIHFDQGKQTMNGETALKFVRSRHAAQHGGDFARGERQQALLAGIENKLLSLGAVDNAIPFFNKLKKSVETDINEASLEELLSLVGDPTDFKLIKINLTTENVLDSATSSDGQFILVPKEGIGKWEKVHRLIKEKLEATNG